MPDPSTAPEDEMPAPGRDELDVGRLAATLAPRYRILGCLARGSMGVVFRAFDDALGRVVAIKLGHDRSASNRRRDPETIRGRLRVEARAMAGLCHPNVVPLFAITSAGDHVAIAMELVAGRTLGEWLASPRRWQEVIEVLCAAGDGLVAAHAAGVLHRDIKPDNLLVGDDGRTRIADFGLAMIVGMPVPPTEDDLDDPPVAGHALTQTGMAVGTPAYMAIEQHTGGLLDHRTDQFGFCATAYEALFGVRPFVGDTTLAIARAKRRMRLSAPRAGADVPVAVRAAIIRGLSPDPADRHPSMASLLEILRGALVERPSRWRAAAIATAAMVAAAVLALLPTSAAPPGEATVAAEPAARASVLFARDAPSTVVADHYYSALAGGDFGRAARAAEIMADRLAPADPDAAKPWRRHAQVAQARASRAVRFGR